MISRLSEWPQEVSEYSFNLPNDLIAQAPSENRSESRLLVVRMNSTTGLPRFEDLKFSDLPELVKSTPQLKNSLWVRNTTSVMPARFFAQRPTGGKHEIVLLQPIDSDELKWKAIIRGIGDFKYPQKLIEPLTGIEFFSPEKQILDFSKTDWCKAQRPADVKHWLADVGKYPLPPYITNYIHERDKERYQTVWRDPLKDYSAASPTASLHFDERILAKLDQASVNWAQIVLHVGLGTFEPLRSPIVDDNTLHWEHFEIQNPELRKIQNNQESLLAVGTTVLRCLESLESSRAQDTEILTDDNGSLKGRTRIFIKPSTPNQRVKHLLTNFHLSESSLFILVATFCKSLSLAKEAYAHAINKKYRFFSYGDASIWIAD
jgi:S-adenosylmethionine:tRNA ribosyltransferase-isomerase